MKDILKFSTKSDVFLSTKIDYLILDYAILGLNLITGNFSDPVAGELIYDVCIDNLVVR